MRILEKTLASLKCHFVDDLPSNLKPELIAIFCHGYGASGTDLVPLGEELLGICPALSGRVQFVFPEAIIPLEDMGIPGGRAWWPIDMVKLQLANATGRFDELRKKTPEGLIDARQAILELIDQLTRLSGLGRSQIVLGGFSQGAMLSTDVALHLDSNLAALIAISGTLINEAEWLASVAQHSGLTVLQSHGRADPLLPFSGAERLRELLTNGGIAVDFIPFEGGHTIPYEVLDQIGFLLQQLLGKS